MIRFFISSTFADMKEEREVLHKDILPRLREIGRTQGESVEICDLRWGIDSEEIAMIASTCLDQIDECRPYFIAFLGDHYGTIPDSEIIRSVWEERAGNTALEGYHMSLTQMEIEYAVLNRADSSVPVKGICFVRNIKGDGVQLSDQHSEEQEELKSRLAASDIKMIPYEAEWDQNNQRATGLENLEESIVKELEEIIKENKEESEIKNWVEREFLEAEGYSSSLAANFGGREKLKQQLLDLAEDDIHSTICVSGASGCGKSSLLSAVYNILKEKEELTTGFIAGGTGSGSRTYLDILLQMIYFIEKPLNKILEKEGEKDINTFVRSYYSEEKAEEKFRNLVQNYDKKGDRKIVLFVDGLDTDNISASGRINIPWLLDDCKGGLVTIICSQIQKPEDLSEHTESIDISEDLKKEDVSAMVEKDMAKPGNETAALIDALWSRPGARSPLYVASSLLIMKMHLIDVQEKDNNLRYQYFKDKVDNFNEELSLHCWDTIEAAGKYLGFPFYRQVAGFIAVSEKGLREQDLEVLLADEGWATLGFVRFRRYLDNFFRCDRIGRWTFGHDLIKKGVRDILLFDETNSKKSALLEYVKTLEYNDEIRIEEGLPLCVNFKDYEFAAKILKDAVPASKDIHESIMQILWRLTDSVEGERWYCELIKREPKIMRDILERGLYYDRSAEYNRRYPAKELADRFWQEQLDKNEGVLNKYGKLNEAERMAFCSHCAEYVGIHDDISRQWEAFPYELPVYKFVCEETAFEKLTEEEKAQVFRIANLVFYSNNKIISEILKNEIPATDEEKELAEEISASLINWYVEELEETGVRFAGRESTEGKFINNIGQYYNGIRDFEKAYPYRVRALQTKSKGFIKAIGEDYTDWEEQFKKLLSEVDAKVHRDFWKEIRSRFDVVWNAMSDEKKRKTRLDTQWNTIAVSYRTMAADNYGLAEELERQPEDVQKKRYEILRRGLEYLELCHDMQGHDAVQRMEKEKIVTDIRWIGMAAHLYPIFALKERDHLISTIRTTETRIRQHADLDAREKEKLSDNIEVLIKNLESDSKYGEELQNIQNRLLGN